MKPTELLDKVKIAQEALLMCIQHDCNHCIYRDYKNNLYNCSYHKNIYLYNLLESYKGYLQTFEDYRNGI